MENDDLLTLHTEYVSLMADHYQLVKEYNEMLIEVEVLREEVDRLRVQLAGCLVASEGHAIGDNDAKCGDYGWSPAFESVKELRKKHDELKKVDLGGKI